MKRRARQRDRCVRRVWGGEDRAGERIGSSFVDGEREEWERKAEFEESPLGPGGQVWRGARRLRVLGLGVGILLLVLELLVLGRGVLVL